MAVFLAEPLRSLINFLGKIEGQGPCASFLKCVSVCWPGMEKFIFIFPEQTPAVEVVFFSLITLYYIKTPLRWGNKK